MEENTFEKYAHTGHLATVESRGSKGHIFILVRKLFARQETHFSDNDLVI